jgi:hypothetical protein
MQTRWSNDDNHVEAKLCGLVLAYRGLLRDHFSHGRRDPVWKARIAELEERADTADRARTLAADLTWTLTDNI